MALYRKKPVVVEARRFDLQASKDSDTLQDAFSTALEQWCHGSIRGVRLPPGNRVLQIQTLEGEMNARVGDWIIKGVKGEFYPCKPDIFEATYEEVESDGRPGGE